MKKSGAKSTFLLRMSTSFVASTKSNHLRVGLNQNYMLYE
jgi:hypothetical protein